MDTTRTTRRRVLGTLGAAGLVGLAGCGGDGGDGEDGTGGTGGDGTGEDGTGGGDGGGATDDGPSGSLSIGVLQDFSGPLPYYGQQGLWGFLAGLAYKQDADQEETVTPIDADGEGDHSLTVGDVDVELLVRDTQFDPGEAQTIATNLVQQDDVDMLYGVANSEGASRVINQVVTQAEVPFVVGPAASADITASEETCSELVFRANENTAMDARSGGVYVARETDVENVALFGADYSFGQAVVNNYEKVFETEGVNVVTKRFVPRGYAEWEGLLSDAQDAGAEGLVGGFTAQTLVPFGRSFVGGDYDMQLFGGFASRVTISQMGNFLQNELGEGFTREDLENAQFGPFTSRYHWNQYENEINNWFIENYTATYGVVPDLFTGGAFTAASSILQAMAESGSTDAADIAEGMRGMTVTDTPKGEGGYTYQEYNNQARSEMTVAPVVPTDTDDWSPAIQPGTPITRIPAEDVTIPEDDPDMTCSL